MTRQDFERLVQTYGSKANNWPVNIRESALNFISENPDDIAATLMEEEQLDLLLDKFEAQPASELLKARILKKAQITPQNFPAVRPRMEWQKIAAMLFMAFSTGFIGAKVISPSTVEAPIDPLLAENTQEEWSDMADNLGLDDIYAWVEGSDI